MGDSTSENYSTYYHHTDRQSAQKIIESGYIKQSDPKNGDAAFGPGTYLTKDTGPAASKTQVAKNNYDGKTDYWENKVDSGKADVTFEVTVPVSRVEKCHAGDRDVHRYKGDLDLKDAKRVDVHVRGKDGTKKYTAK